MLNVTTRREVPVQGLELASSPWSCGTLVRQGGRHREKGRNCQDHAVALTSEHGVVLVVADGVSAIPREGRRMPTHAEVGAYLVAEVAARAAFAALDSQGPDEVRAAVARALVAVVGPLWRQLGRDAPLGLSTTLVIAVTTRTWTWAWAAGDGAWGLLVPPGVRPAVVDQDDDGLLTTDEGASRRGGRNLERLDDCVARRAAQGPAAVAELLEPVVMATGPATALWVATDGLRDELGVADVLRRPVRAPRDLARALTSATDSDDVAIAYAAGVGP